jgi:integrase
MRTDPARERAAERLKEIRAGVDVKGEATMGDLIVRYLQHAKAHKAAKSFEQDEGYLRRGVSQEIRAQRLSTITREQLEDLHGAVGRTRGKSAANHLIKCVRHMLELAKDWNMLRGENPCRVNLFKLEPPTRFLSKAEFLRLNKALLEEGDWRWRAYFPLALALGLRKTELMRLTWNRVDFEDRTLRLTKTKNGKPLTLPLSDEVISMLSELPSHGTSDFVFPGNREGKPLAQVNGAFDRICARAGVTDFRVHDLRHSFASFQLQAGVSLTVISKMMNHSSLGQTDRYAHLQIDDMRTPLSNHAALILGVTELPSDGEAPNAVAEG